MNIVRLFFTLLISLCFVADVNAQKIKSVRNIEWLEGHWMMEGKKGNTYEQWRIVDDNRMEGSSYKVYKKDTTMRETLELIIENGEVIYIANVKGQNNDQPVRFKMIDGNRRHMDFENREHDFPKEIKYHWKQNDRYDVEVIGPMKPGSKKNKIILLSFKKQD